MPDLTSPAQPAARLETRDVRRVYRDVHAVEGVDLKVHAGEILALVGLNGAGKTTLMRLLLAMVRPSGGTVQVLGHDAAQCTAAQWARVGHLIETPFAYPELTVHENVVVAGRLHGLSAADAGPAATDVLRRLALESFAQRRSRTLSLGNRQRLGLACAMVHRPDVLVLDEPTNALDPRGVLVVRAALRDAAQRSAAVLVSSHHLDEVARVADRIAVMHRGRVIGTLDPAGADLERAFFAMVYDAEPQEVTP